MVFSNLPTQEKDAFFALLDEYFTSRPDLLGNLGAAGSSIGGVSTTAAASAVQRALASNPKATSKIVSAGLKHQGVPKSSPYAALVNDAVGRAVASPKDKEEEEAGGSGWAKVLYEFEPQEADELALEEGQRVLVTAKGTDGWWTGKLGAKSGKFPASYVQLL